MIEILIAVLIDLMIGDPFGLYHPICLIGNLITLTQRIFYKDTKLAGLIFLISNIVIVLGTLLIIRYVISFNTYLRFIVTVYLLYTSLACHSLIHESNKVLRPLRNGDILNARKYLGYIVGRDTNELSEEKVAKACVETVAENTIDGVIAPLFYIFIGLLFGYAVELVFLYKLVNTLDSRVGYKNEKYKNFGFFSAKLDDVLNFIPARIGGIFMLLAGSILGYNFRNGLKVFLRDRLNHKSPNSAHPESVIAGLLGIQLGGGNYYFGKYVDKPTIGDSMVSVNYYHIRQTQFVLLITTILFTITIAGGYMLWN